MKIIQSIAAIYEAQFEINKKVKEKVDYLITSKKDERWHYFSRIKSKESFALKIETGRFNNPRSLEDFFACTIVVDNLSQINKAEEIIKKSFVVVRKKPESRDITNKEPSSFVFDDVRIYAKLKAQDNMPQSPLYEVEFEIQVKTFLQHAWGIATHDLIYKSDEISWAKERVAFQIKALLEQSEVAISGVDGLVSTPELNLESTEVKELKKILIFYKEHFSKDNLPVDLIRLCKNTRNLMKACKLKLDVLIGFLKAETSVGRGSKLMNLSPFLIVVNSIIKQDKVLIQDNIINKKKSKYKIIIPKELDLSDVEVKKEINLIKI